MDLSQVASELESQKDNVVGISEVVLNTLVVLSFLFMIINIVFHITDNKKAIVSFAVVRKLIRMNSTGHPGYLDSVLSYRSQQKYFVDDQVLELLKIK